MSIFFLLMWYSGLCHKENSFFYCLINDHHQLVYINKLSCLFSYGRFLLWNELNFLYRFLLAVETMLWKRNIETVAMCCCYMANLQSCLLASVEEKVVSSASNHIPLFIQFRKHPSWLGFISLTYILLQKLACLLATLSFSDTESLRAGAVHCYMLLVKGCWVNSC